MPTGGVQRQVKLPPAPESARQARRFVAEVLQAARADSLVDTAALLTSELVTNGIVHAHTEMQVVVEATSAWVRVEVIDGNPMLPARRGYDAEALTGRGLEMVELLADDFGMQPLENDGKRVWFRLGSVGADSDMPHERATARGATVTVRLRNLPVMLYSAWQAHADAMLRDATLAELAQAGASLPNELTLTADALSALALGTNDLFSSTTELPHNVDVDVELPRAVAPNFPVLRDVLRRCSERSAAGELLVPPSLPEIQAVRRWVCDEVGRQSQGLSARPWTDVVIDDVPVDPMSADAIDAVRASPLAQIAADRWNRIIAVSRGAATLLGSTAAALEGQRVIAIIPARLRDAHVAGFTRQMLGGAPRLLGHATEMPALRPDGSEIVVLLELERRTDSGGRPLFVATLTPVTGAPPQGAA